MPTIRQSQQIDRSRLEPAPAPAAPALAAAPPPLSPLAASPFMVCSLPAKAGNYDTVSRQFYGRGPNPQQRIFSVAAEAGSGGSSQPGPKGDKGDPGIGEPGPKGDKGDPGPASVGSVNFVDSETPSGTINGVNATFPLAHAPSPASSLLLFLNTAKLKAGIGYTLSGSTITYLAGYIPVTGDVHEACYRY